MHENQMYQWLIDKEGCAVYTIDIGQSANTILSCYIILHDTNCSIAYMKSSFHVFTEIAIDLFRTDQDIL